MAIRREQLGWWPPLTYGERLRMVRHEYGRRQNKKVTQREMAKLVGVPYGNYAAWEAGNGTPTDNVGVAKAIGKVTGVDPLWLLGWFDEPPPDDGPSAPEESSAPTKWYSPPSRAA